MPRKLSLYMSYYLAHLIRAMEFTTKYAKQCACHTKISLLPVPVCTSKLHIAFITHFILPKPIPSLSLSLGLQPNPRSHWVSTSFTTSSPWTSVQEGNSQVSNLRPVLLERTVWLVFVCQASQLVTTSASSLAEMPLTLTQCHNERLALFSM